VAREAEAASPLTGRNYEITALPMCNGQRPVKSTESDSVNEVTSEKIAENSEVSVRFKGYGRLQDTQ
jgi:hypothetical protein